MYSFIDYYTEKKKREGEIQNKFLRGDIWISYFPYRFRGDKIEIVGNDGYVEEKRIDSVKPHINSEGILNATEFRGVFKFKHRPVIILSTLGDYYCDRAWRGQETIIVAPVYSLRNETTKEYRGDKDFVWNIITYQYRSLFYLPESPKYDLHESVIHFDDLMAVNCSWLTERRSACLSTDAMMVFDNWLHFYLFNEINGKVADLIKDYRQYLGELL